MFINFIKKSLLVVVLATGILLLSPSANKVFAAPCSDFNKTILGVPTWYKYLDGEDVEGKCQPRLESASDALPIGLAVFEGALTLGGIVAGAMILYGGFKYVLSQGESDKAAAGRKTAMNALIGLVILMMAARVVSFIAGRIG